MRGLTDACAGGNARWDLKASERLRGQPKFVSGGIWEPQRVGSVYGKIGGVSSTSRYMTRNRVTNQSPC